jgi:hypothetical protein
MNYELRTIIHCRVFFFPAIYRRVLQSQIHLALIYPPSAESSPSLAEGVYMLDRTDVELMFNNGRRCKNLKNSQKSTTKIITI